LGKNFATLILAIQTTFFIILWRLDDHMNIQNLIFVFVLVICIPTIWYSLAIEYIEEKQPDKSA